ncbi:hypothetical protein [Fontivita pretiosa]|uniref:hypothetical protein n=1 Tax=Fontivita pretiosa TaxID=2989684 RepID=UPI003D171E97
MSADLLSDSELSEVAARVEEVLLNRYQLRVRPEMIQYVSRRLRQSQQTTIPVMGGDARTGVAIRQLLPADELRAALTPISRGRS